MKNLFSLILIILLALSLTVTVFAEEADPSVSSEGNTDLPPTTTVHTHTWETSTTAATCTEAGSTTRTCSGCGESTTEAIPATGHSYGGWINVDASSHKGTCGACGAETTTAHSWGSGTVNIAPTCTTQGQKTYTCSCGAISTETLGVTDHTYGAWTSTDDSHSRSCSGCGKEDSGSHSWAVTETVAATCKDAGLKKLACACGKTKTETIAKLTTHTYETECDADCDICGATRDASHKYNTNWSKNSSQHWHTCTVCGDKTDVGNHYPGPAATEEKAQICLTCGLTMTPKLNHVHKYDTQWSNDETGHWYACEGCEDQKDLEDHVYDDPCDSDCNVCGYTTDNAHDYSGSWSSDETGHWAVCSICGVESDVVAHVASPDTPEGEAQLCSVCNFEIAPAQEHDHVFGDDWQHDAQSHWKVCECGETGETEVHAWDEGTKDGKFILYRCTDCTATRTEDAPKAQFPMWIIPLVLCIVCLTAAVVLLVMLIKGSNSGGKYRK